MPGIMASLWPHFPMAFPACSTLFGTRRDGVGCKLDERVVCLVDCASLTEDKGCILLWTLWSADLSRNLGSGHLGDTIS